MKAEKGTEVTYDVQAIPRVTSQGLRVRCCVPGGIRAQLQLRGELTWGLLSSCLYLMP